jgi:hypothetical protein
LLFRLVVVGKLCFATFLTWQFCPLEMPSYHTA